MYIMVTVIEEIRLAGSEIPGRGRVEVYIGQVNEWGTVCDDGFGNVDAQVICRLVNVHRIMITPYIIYLYMSLAI